MRGRKPREIDLAPSDQPVLHWIAQSMSLPWYQVQRARIVLAIAAGERTRAVAEKLNCDDATVWRVCRRYELSGLSGLLANGRRRSA